MPKYAIWDKTSDIYSLTKSPTSGKMRWTAAEYIEEEAPWAGQPHVKVIVGGGAVNGAFFLDFDERVEFYKRQGADFTDCMSDDEVLAVMERFDGDETAAGTPYEPSNAEVIQALEDLRVDLIIAGVIE